MSYHYELHAPNNYDNNFQNHQLSIVEFKMHIRRLQTLTLLTAILSGGWLAACGDDSENTNADPFIVPTQEPGTVDSDGVTSNDVSETEVTPDLDRGAAELFGAPCIRDAVCATDLCSGNSNAPGVCTLTDEVQFVAFDELIANPETYANQRLQTEGIIRGVCQRRGCWMELRSEDNPAGENMNVKFLDYGFFVPLDSRGAFVRVEGVPAVQTLSAEEVEELLAEGYDPGVVRDDGTAVLIRFLASGVMMWNRAD